MSLEPVRVSLEPVRVSLEPVRVSLEPLRVSLQPLRVSLQPLRVSLQPLRASIQPRGLPGRYGNTKQSVREAVPCMPVVIDDAPRNVDSATAPGRVVFGWVSK